MFFHLRDAAEDMERNRARLCRRRGALLRRDRRCCRAHCGDGSFHWDQRLLASRSAESIEAVKRLPAERLLLETDAPCCDVRKSHAGWPLLVASGAPPRRKVDKKKEKKKWVQRRRL
tara:strand:+ start:64 stop:414 length:351 start_codon:yes stop_codon:yes gene_type:complete